MSTIKVNGIRGVGASTDAISVNNTDGTCTAKITNNLSNRNLVINGSMQIAQRGDTTGVEYGYGGCDRWRFSGGSAARVTMQRQGTASAPTNKGFGFCQRLDVTTADASLAAGDYNMLSYKWEGQDLQQIKKGTAAAESLIVSFWVSSPKTGTHILELYDQPNTRQVSKAYTVSAADTWEKKTVTFPADTTGTITNDNAARLTLEFWLCAGSTYSSGTLNTSWAAITNANRAVGQVNCMDNTSNDFLITGVQVEIDNGSGVATDFEHRSYGDELSRCQRYFYMHCDKLNDPIGMGTMYNTTNAVVGFSMPVTMRADPSLVYTGGTNYFKVFCDGSNDECDALDSQESGLTFFNLYVKTNLSVGTDGFGCWARCSNASARVSLNAEL